MEGKIMKNKIHVLLLTALLITGCSSDLGRTGEGTAPEIEIDGVEVVVGDTKIKKLYDAGFDKGYKTQSFAGSTIDASTVMSQSVSLEKKDTKYASIYLVNPNNNSADVEDCIIYRMMYFISEPSDKVIMKINGVDYQGYTIDKIKKEMENTDMKLKEETESSLIYEDGDYTLEFSLSEGMLYYIIVDIDIEAEIVIE